MVDPAALVAETGAGKAVEPVAPAAETGVGKAVEPVALAAGKVVELVLVVVAPDYRPRIYLSCRHILVSQ